MEYTEKVSLLNFGSPEERYEYEQFVSHHPYGSFSQSLAWRQVKENWGHEAVVVRDSDGNIQAAMLILVKSLPLLHSSFLYAPRGPVCFPEETELLPLLFQGIIQAAKKHRACLFRMDPMILESDTRFLGAMACLGFSHTLKANEDTTVQCRSHYHLPLDGKTQEEIFSAFKSKWRYNIRLASRRGVTCGYYGPERLDDFMKLMRETGHRDHFAIRSREYFLRLMNAFGSACRLYFCEYNGEPLSGAIAIQYAGKTAYVYGASSSRHRNLMPCYLMQWSMIQWAIESGCSLYDFQGIPHFDEPDHPNYGVYRFKQGFSGEVVVYAGEFDYIFSPCKKAAMDFCQTGFRRLVHLRLFAQDTEKKVTEKLLPSKKVSAMPAPIPEK